MMENHPYAILVIDDEAPMLFGVKTLLKRNGYHAITCNNSLEGIRLAQENHPDLIVCDIMMPFKNGYEVKEQLAANPVTRDIPFLFLSARARQTDKLRGFKSGVDDYITKPFDPRELIARVEAVFRRHEKGRSSAEQEMTLQLERIKTEISHNISHELRTPMTQIILALEMVLREKYEDADDLKWFVDTALSQSLRLNSIIDDLVFLSNYDMGYSTFLRQGIRLEQDIKEPITVRQKMYNEKNLRVEIYVATDVAIHAPRREFRQAAVHLVDNAMKFAPPMTTIMVDLEANGQGGCILTVSDYGAGIPAELREKVFERFYQISQGDTRRYGGLGVGLTIARAIARSLGGDVVILPSERGCRVQMTLPPAPLDMP